MNETLKHIHEAKTGFALKTKYPAPFRKKNELSLKKTKQTLCLALNKTILNAKLLNIYEET